MKYVIEADLSDGDCSFCPCFQRRLNEEADCDLAEKELTGVLRDAKTRPDDKVVCFDRPEWCPLRPYEEVLAGEWIDSINKQPLEDEPRETVRIELFESETEKLDAMSLANKLNRAQMIAKLIGDYSIAIPYVNHGDHGPEPRFEGDAWTMWHCCGNCDHPVSYGDGYCRTCGAVLDWEIGPKK